MYVLSVKAKFWWVLHYSRGAHSHTWNVCKLQIITTEPQTTGLDKSCFFKKKLIFQSAIKNDYYMVRKVMLRMTLALKKMYRENFEIFTVSMLT